MLQRCLNGSARILRSAEACCGQAAAVQNCRPLQAKAPWEGQSCYNSSAGCQHDAQLSPRAAAAGALSRASAALHCKAGGLQDTLQASSRCLSSAFPSSLKDFAVQQQAVQSYNHHRAHNETLAGEQLRSFAKASRLAQPATRAARKVAERLPVARQPAAGTKGCSSEQPDLTKQESSSDAVVTQAEHSRASDIQVRPVLQAKAEDFAFFQSNGGALHE